MVAGGAVSSRQIVDSGPIHAGATIEAEPPTDAFDRGTNKVIDNPDGTNSGRRITESDEPDHSGANPPVAAAISQANPEIAAAGTHAKTSDTEVTNESSDRTDPVEAEMAVTERSTVDDSATDNIDTTQVTESPLPPTNPVEQDVRPLHEMSEEEIRERLADYRAWVQKGQIDIELDLGRLSADQIQALVDFYVLNVDGTKLAIDPNGKALQLEEIPPGRLITDLNDERHWPAFTRPIASRLLGRGPKLLSMSIVLNDKAELHLYRVLVDGLAEAFPKSGTTVFIGITVGEDGRLYFAVLKVVPNQLAGKE